MRPVSLYIDLVLSWLKWPTAFAASALVIPASIAFAKVLVFSAASDPRTLFAFVVGCVGYILVWFILFRRTKMTFFSTLEHELTHAIFALLTLHPVTGIRSTFTDGGQMTFKGRGNWLITLAPYFVPTFCLGVCLIVEFVPNSVSWGSVAFGVALGYHIISTYHETHRHQSDLKKVGFLFSFMLLPFANVFMLGWCITIFCGQSAHENSFFDYLRTAVNDLISIMRAAGEQVA